MLKKYHRLILVGAWELFVVEVVGLGLVEGLFEHRRTKAEETPLRYILVGGSVLFVVEVVAKSPKGLSGLTCAQKHPHVRLRLFNQRNCRRIVGAVTKEERGKLNENRRTKTRYPKRKDYSTWRSPSLTRPLLIM